MIVKTVMRHRRGKEGRGLTSALFIQFLYSAMTKKTSVVKTLFNLPSFSFHAKPMKGKRLPNWSLPRHSRNSRPMATIPASSRLCNSSDSE